MFFLAAAFCSPATRAQELTRSEQLLPQNTRAWLSIPSSEKLREAFQNTRFSEMGEDPELKPLVEDLERQFRKFLDEQNVQFGLRLEDLEGINAGEICLAGILNQPQQGADESAIEHSIVLLVDVADSQDEARALLEKVAGEMKDRNATADEIQIGEVHATKWTFPEVHGRRVRDHAFHSVVGRWLIACDRESVFRNLVNRLGGASADEPGHLADNPVFQSVIEQTEMADEFGPPHLRWFIEPLGYVTLIQAIGDERLGARNQRNDYVRILREEGFSAVKGVGGAGWVGTGKHEFAHRTFIHAPHSPEAPFERGAQILNFTNETDSDLGPPAWVPANAASYLSFTWDLRGALDHVGYIADSAGGSEGSWQRALDGMRDDPNGARVDVRRVAELLEDRVTAVGVTELPINEESERLVFGVKILEDEEFVAEMVYRFVKDKAQVIDYEGVRILLIDDALIDEAPGLEIDDEFEGEFGEPAEEDDEFAKPRPLFQKKVWAVAKGHLLMTNHLDQMKSVISQMDDEPGKVLAAAPDFQRVQACLSELAGDALPSFRHFGRSDMSIWTNYEMMRTGRMGQSKTILAQILNRAMEEEDAPDDAVREQKIDGSKMPEDFEGKVAKYFGPSGMVLHTSELGWTITGCILAREDSTSSPGAGELNGGSPSQTKEAGSDEKAVDKDEAKDTRSNPDAGDNSLRSPSKQADEKMDKDAEPKNPDPPGNSGDKKKSDEKRSDDKKSDDDDQDGMRPS